MDVIRIFQVLQQILIHFKHSNKLTRRGNIKLLKDVSSVRIYSIRANM